MTDILLRLFPWYALFNVLVLGIATGAISLVITKASIFNPMHDWLEKHIPFLGALLDCPWCTSHWIALFFTLAYRPLLLDWTGRPAWQMESWFGWFMIPVDYLVTISVMVTIAMFTARMIYSAVKSFNV